MALASPLLCLTPSARVRASLFRLYYLRVYSHGCGSATGNVRLLRPDNKSNQHECARHCGRPIGVLLVCAGSNNLSILAPLARFMSPAPRPRSLYIVSAGYLALAPGVGTGTFHMWRVRLLFILAGLIIVGAAGAVIDLPAAEQYNILLGIKLLVAPAAIEGALQTFAGSVRRQGGQVSLLGPRLITYGVAIFIVAGSNYIAVSPSVEHPAHLALSALTVFGVEVLARLIRRLVLGGAPAAAGRESVA